MHVPTRRPPDRAAATSGRRAAAFALACATLVLGLCAGCTRADTEGAAASPADAGPPAATSGFGNPALPAADGTSDLAPAPAPAPAAKAGAAALPAGSLRVQAIEIIDRNGFDKPLVAATMMVPAGWQHQSAVEWKLGNRCGPPTALRVAAVAPDGSAGIELVPGDSWASNNFGIAGGECPAGDFTSTQQYLQAWVQQHRPNARVLDYRPRPDKSRPAQEQQFPGGGGSSVRLDSGQLLIAYQDAQGRDLRETLVANVLFSETRFAGLQGKVMQTLQGQSFGVLAWRAPEGVLDFRQFDAVWNTLQPGAEWKARMDAANGEMAADNARTQAEIGRIRAETSRETLAHIARRGQIMAQTRAEISDMQNNGWRASQDSNDRMHRETVRTVREVNAYRDPRSGGVVELSSHYNHAWQLRDGSYVLTDSPNFDPARDLGVQGEQLVRTR